MQIGVAVISQETQRILPGTSLFVGIVGLNLIYQYRGFLQGPGRQTAYGSIELVRQHIAAFTVVEQTVVVVCDIATYLTERILALITEQEVVRRCVAPVARQHAVVPGTIAKQQKVTWHRAILPCPIVEHLHVAAIGIGIGSAAGELIVEFVGRHDVHLHPVVRLMECLETLCLTDESLRRRNDDDHIGLRIGMMILIRDAIDIFRCRE